MGGFKLIPRSDVIRKVKLYQQDAEWTAVIRDGFIQ